jgi:hypothetical protein
MTTSRYEPADYLNPPSLKFLDLLSRRRPSKLAMSYLSFGLICVTALEAEFFCSTQNENFRKIPGERESGASFG